MPVKTNLTVIETIEADVFRITAVNISMPASGHPSIQLHIACGREQTDGTVKWIKTKKYTIMDQNVKDAEGNILPEHQYYTNLASTLTSGGPFYEEEKEAYYNHAISRGWIPEGVIK